MFCLESEEICFYKMETQSVEAKGESYTSYVGDKRLLGLLPMFILVLIIVLRISWTLYKSFGQKTRNPQQRRMAYVGSRARPSLGQAEPTIYVSPNNLPPPPKYECMAPPSYEEVVGVHYPNYQIQPITQPITTALAQSSTENTENRNNDTVTRINEIVARNNEVVARNNEETVAAVPRPVTAAS